MLLGTFLGRSASAENLFSPDEERARRHFETGRDAYDRRDYGSAVAEFEAARRIYPRPAFDYNIALANDRLGREAEAEVAYKRYLDSAPEGPDAMRVWKRLGELHARLHPSVPPRRRYVIAGSVGGSALVLLGVGGGLLGAAGARFDEAQASPCGQAMNCDPAGIDRDIRSFDYTGKTLLVAGAALLAVDIGLWIWATRP